MGFAIVSCKEDIIVPRGLKKGEAKIELVIMDDKNKPKVWFAVEGQKVDGWQPMTSIDLT